MESKNGTHINFPTSLYVFYLMFGLWLFALLVYVLSFFKYTGWLFVCIISGIVMIISLRAALKWGKELEKKMRQEKDEQEDLLL